MKRHILFFFSIVIIFISCKSAEEERLLQIGNDIVATSEKIPLSDSLTPFDKIFKADSLLFKDIDGLSPFIFTRIKENGPLAKQLKISTSHKFSEAGLRLYILIIKGPEKNTTADFLMTITCTYTGGRFHVISVSGGLGCG